MPETASATGATPTAAAHSDTGHIVQSLVVNLAIATAKGVAAVFTGSGAMVAEAIHSGADCANQVLLLIGVRRARRPPDALHPLGYGRAIYFWSFIVALLLFSGGGVFSIAEGIEKLLHPEPIERVWLGFAILGFSLVLEGGATISNVREIGRRRGSRGFFEYLKTTKDSDLVVVFAENAAASAGLVLAMTSLGLAAATGDARFDGLGSLLVGVVLVLVAVFLAREVKSLLLGESADPEVEAAARAVAAKHPEITEVFRVLTIQQGPGEVMVAAKLHFTPGLSADALCTVINAFERDLREACPAVRWSFIEPDVTDA